MLAWKEILSPSRLNPVQRQGFFGSLALAALVVFLHFPFEGYDIEHYVITRYATSRCEKPKGLLDMTKEQLDYARQEVIRCAEFNAAALPEQGEMQIRSFPEWRSKAPIIEWFGSLIHAIVALVFAFTLGGLWLWVFRTNDSG